MPQIFENIKLQENVLDKRSTPDHDIISRNFFRVFNLTQSANLLVHNGFPNEAKILARSSFEVVRNMAILYLQKKYDLKQRYLDYFNWVSSNISIHKHKKLVDLMIQIEKSNSRENQYVDLLNVFEKDRNQIGLELLKKYLQKYEGARIDSWLQPAAKGENPFKLSGMPIGLYKVEIWLNSYAHGDGVALERFIDKNEGIYTNVASIYDKLEALLFHQFCFSNMCNLVYKEFKIDRAFFDEKYLFPLKVLNDSLNKNNITAIGNSDYFHLFDFVWDDIP